MSKELTIKQALVEWYKKPINEITLKEKDKFYSMVFPCYKMDLSEEEKNQVNDITDRSCYE
tara:strand:+ start:70 stop:252 length:183 start_codon:yes stop_codon:yes gene_type:complete